MLVVIFMARKQDLACDVVEREAVPAWGAIDQLGHRAALYLSTEDKLKGVVLLISSAKPHTLGIAWWQNDWSDLSALGSQIKWSGSPLDLLSWATDHPIAQNFDPLLHYLKSEVQRTAN